MKGFSYLWHMAWRRKAACLLVVVATMVATVFMLFYPELIENTRKRLEETYQGITVTGSIVSTGVSAEIPAVSGSFWEEIQESGYFSDLYASGAFSIRAVPKEMLEQKAGKNASEQEQLVAFQNLLTQTEEESGIVSGSMRAYNTFSAEDELVRIQEDIRWLDGYDESCLEGNERICIVSDQWGYALGDTIPLLARVLVSKDYLEGIFRMKVVGTYPGKITGIAAVMPLKTMKDLTLAANAVQKQNGSYYEWNFGLREVYFTIKDNQQLMQIKTMITENGLRDSKFARVRIDDRILKETVGPIESNLAQLEGSYLFFFVMIAAIGFFLSFLLARGRKPEYAVMRMLGESRAQITIKALCEQFVLCLIGVLLGAAAVGVLEKSSFEPSICAVILLCYTLGAAVAVMLTVRVNVMDILRDKE